MRRTRWDKKQDENKSLPSSSNWSSSNQEALNWDRNDSTASIENRMLTPTSHPLDYSRTSEKRNAKDLDDSNSDNHPIQEKECANNVGKPVSELPTETTSLGSVVQHPWSFFPGENHIYPGSSSEIAYQSDLPWSRDHPDYYPNSSYPDPNVFNVKWWNDSRDSSIKSHRSSGHWPFNSKFGKNDGQNSNYDLNRRFGKYQNISYEHSSKFYRDQKSYSNTGNPRYSNSKYDAINTGNNNRFFRNSCRDTIQENFRSDYHINQYSWNNSNYGPYSSNYDKKRHAYFKSTDDRSKQDKNGHSNRLYFRSKKNSDNERKKDSAAETAKKKALAIAANKLKMTFLAGKKKFKKSTCKKGKGQGTNKISFKTKPRKVKTSKACTKEKKSMEEGFKLKLCAQEWVTEARNSSLLLSQTNAPPIRDTDSDSMQSVTELDKNYSDIESEMELTDSEGNILTVNKIDKSKDLESKPTRRRHLSESYTPVVKQKRVRSYSTSNVNEMVNMKIKNKETSSVASNIKNLFVKQLLTMDKNSIEELVKNPKSRKAQFMMNHFVTMQRVAVSQKLNQFRFKHKPLTSFIDDDDLQILQTITADQIEKLPPDIMQQVKEILTFEECGKAEQIWEEVSLSLSDLVSGFGVSSSTQKSIPTKTTEKDKNSHAEDLEIEIVTPPPKTPATTITIPDSDTDLPEDKTPGPQASSDKSPSSSPLQNENLTQFLKPHSLLHSSPGRHISESSLPPLTPLLQHFATPDLPTRDTSVNGRISPSHQTTSPLPTDNRLPCLSPPHALGLSVSPWSSPALSPVPKLCEQQKLSKNNEETSSQLLCRIPCDMSTSSHSIKVKQERPSPVIECGFCLHAPRSPHTSHCAYAFGIPRSPVPLMPGSPRPLTNAPQRPVPRLGSSTLPRIFKMERPEIAASFVSLDHVNRPSSEERPKNPAPPDTANSEPASPLPIPPPQPRPLIFSPDARYRDPPRPLSPPPPQHSPRTIKMERQTPQYICCCMRNECETRSSSRHSVDFRHSVVTPQNLLCNGNHPTTPHMYKIEPPYLSNGSSRSRTPHGIGGLFPIPTSSVRLNGGIGVQNSIPEPNRINVGVQTDIICNATDQARLARSEGKSFPVVTNKVDRTTSTEDLINPNSNGLRSSTEGADLILEINNWKYNVDEGGNHILSIDFNQQMLQMAYRENEILERVRSIEDATKKLAEERSSLIKCFQDLNNKRTEQLKKALTNANSFNNQANDSTSSIYSNVNKSELVGNFQENSVVTSSQEVFVKERKPSIDCEEESIERCTSTSLRLEDVDISASVEERKPLFELHQLIQKRNRSSLSSDDDETNIHFKRHRYEANVNTTTNLLDNKTGEVPNALSSCENENLVHQSIKEEQEEALDVQDGIVVMQKNSLLSSPQSPKMRNSSGSEHGYSLRSRGPPSDLLDFNSDSQSKDLSFHEDQIDLMDSSVEKCKCQDDEQADDEHEREDDALSEHSTKFCSDNQKRKKRKRKSSKHRNKLGQEDSDPSVTLHSLPEPDQPMKVPPPHDDAVLDIKVVGELIFTSSSDGTARLFDPKSGFVLATYSGHTDSVTTVQVVGRPDFRPMAPDFQVITGSEDRMIHVYDGKTGALVKKRNVLEPVRCLDHRWGFLFIGTDGGCGLKWNLKDKKIGEKVQFCGKGITCLIAHVEGGRRVLVVGAKTTPIMVRDAMTGLFLRTLDYLQLSVYAAVFEGSLLHTGGADKNIYTYDFCTGSVKRTINVGSSVSGLNLVSDYLIATCYDGFVRIYNLSDGALLYSLSVESSHKMFICSTVYKNQILLGNKKGEIASCQLPDDLTGTSRVD